MGKRVGISYETPRGAHVVRYTDIDQLATILPKLKRPARVIWEKQTIGEVWWDGKHWVWFWDATPGEEAPR